jgi:hypothetical protein
MEIKNLTEIEENKKITINGIGNKYQIKKLMKTEDMKRFFVIKHDDKNSNNIHNEETIKLPNIFNNQSLSPVTVFENTENNSPLCGIKSTTASSLKLESIKNSSNKERKISLKNNWTDCITNETYDPILQYSIIFDENFEINNKQDILKLIKSEIMQKINSYKHQDMKKHIYSSTKFINYDYVLETLKNNKLICSYCNRHLLIIYNKSREMQQWTIDRIDNDYGHNIDNTIISCLLCNLSRKKINKEKFLFSKQIENIITIGDIRNKIEIPATI